MNKTFISFSTNIILNPFVIFSFTSYYKSIKLTNNLFKFNIFPIFFFQDLNFFLLNKCIFQNSYSHIVSNLNSFYRKNITIPLLTDPKYSEYHFTFCKFDKIDCKQYIGAINIVSSLLNVIHCIFISCKSEEQCSCISSDSSNINVNYSCFSMNSAYHANSIGGVCLRISNNGNININFNFFYANGILLQSRNFILIFKKDSFISYCNLSFGNSNNYFDSSSGIFLQDVKSNIFYTFFDSNYGSSLLILKNITKTVYSFLTFINNQNIQGSLILLFDSILIFHVCLFYSCNFNKIIFVPQKHDSIINFLQCQFDKSFLFQPFTNKYLTILTSDCHFSSPHYISFLKNNYFICEDFLYLHKIYYKKFIMILII